MNTRAPSLALAAAPSLALLSRGIVGLSSSSPLSSSALSNGSLLRRSAAAAAAVVISHKARFSSRARKALQSTRVDSGGLVPVDAKRFGVKVGEKKTCRHFGGQIRMASSSKITDWVKPGDQSGEFRRQSSVFRDWISAEPGARFPPEKGRYHLYVSYACPWACRTLVARKLKGLEDFISYSVVHWHMGEKGWRFPTPEDADAPGENVIPDPVPGHEKFTHLRDLYFSADANYGGRFTVPALWDRQTGTIVNNESSEILRMLGRVFDDQLPPRYRDVDLYPPDLRARIDEAGEWTYDNINNGVYKSGFATTQAAYERNVTALFEALDRAERHLAEGPGPYFFGDRITETDVRLYQTIVRFDPVYVQHFKCNIRDIRSGYPHLHKWVRNLYWNHPAFRDATNFLHVKNHYTRSHTQINPHSITPLGPLPDILPLDEEVAAVKAAL